MPTKETTRRVLCLLALNAKPKEVALAIGISVPTLRKQYFSDPRIRAARLVLKGELLAALASSALDSGNVAANDKLWKRIEKATLEQLPISMKPPKTPKLGKKEQRKLDASKPPVQSSWGDLVEGTCAGSA